MKWRMKRWTIFSCAITFVIGWLAGSIFIFVIFHIHEDISTSTHFFKILKHSTTSNKFLRHESNEKQDEQHISQLHHSLSLKEDQFIRIFFNWPKCEDTLFTIHNYNSFDSILAAYPAASIKILQIFPSLPVNVQHQKLACNFYFHQFDWYRKLGYDVDIVNVDLTSKTNYMSLIGQKYSARWLTSESLQRYRGLRRKITAAASNNTTRRNGQQSHNYDKNLVYFNQKGLIPYHLSTYIRLLHLFQKGGIFVDFSFYFQRRVDLREIEEVSNYFSNWISL